MLKGKGTFGDFRRSDEKIATNILSDRLKRLEAHGIIKKKVDPANRSSLIYTLTEKGKDLVPVMLEITAWSAKHDVKTNAPSTFQEDFKSSRDQVIAAVRAALD
jgi:DNA-binding HxlR family transcriptional regulator